MIRKVLFVMGGALALCLFLTLAMTAAPPFLDASNLDALAIYAYRDWQSTGTVLAADDRVTIHAQGQWLYTPGEWQGPEGHTRFQSPSFYPLPHVRGGALIGKIGETGAPFLVGARYSGRANGPGMLYLRIDDDILSDNAGDVQVNISLERKE